VFLAWCYIAAVPDSSAPAGQDAESWLVGAPPAAAEQRHLAAAPAHTLEPAKHGMGHEAAAPAAAGAPATIYEDPVHEAELAEGGAGTTTTPAATTKKWACRPSTCCRPSTRARCLARSRRRRLPRTAPITTPVGT